VSTESTKQTNCINFISLVFQQWQCEHHFHIPFLLFVNWPFYSPVS